MYRRGLNTYMNTTRKSLIKISSRQIFYWQSQAVGETLRSWLSQSAFLWHSIHNFWDACMWNTRVHVTRKSIGKWKGQRVHRHVVRGYNLDGTVFGHRCMESPKLRRRAPRVYSTMHAEDGSSTYSDKVQTSTAAILCQLPPYKSANSKAFAETLSVPILLKRNHINNCIEKREIVSG